MREHFRVTLAVLRLYLARQRGDLRAVAEEVEQLQSAGALDVAQLGLGEELRALALISLGIAELWSSRLHEAEGHLERGVALARRIGRPFLEINGLAHWGGGRELPVARTGGGARPASDRAGAAARLGRGAVRRDRLSDAGWLVDLAGRTGGGGTVAHGGGICAPVRGRAGDRNAVPSGSRGSRDRPRPCRGGASRPACRRAPARTAAYRSAPAHGGAARVPPAGPRSAGGDRTSRCRLDRDGRRGTRKARYPRRCGSLRTTRERRPPRSRPSSTARPRDPIRCG